MIVETAAVATLNPNQIHNNREAQLEALARLLMGFSQLLVVNTPPERFKAMIDNFWNMASAEDPLAGPEVKAIMACPCLATHGLGLPEDIAGTVGIHLRLP